MLPTILSVIALLLAAAALIYADTQVNAMRSAIRALRREVDRQTRRLNSSDFDPLELHPSPAERRMRHASRPEH